MKMRVNGITAARSHDANIYLSTSAEQHEANTHLIYITIAAAEERHERGG